MWIGHYQQEGNTNDETDSTRLGRIEFPAMSNRVRRLLRKYVEFRIFINLLTSNHMYLTVKVVLDGKRAPDAGSGTRIQIGVCVPRFGRVSAALRIGSGGMLSAPGKMYLALTPMC